MERVEWVSDKVLSEYLKKEHGEETVQEFLELFTHYDNTFNPIRLAGFINNIINYLSPMNNFFRKNNIPIKVYSVYDGKDYFIWLCHFDDTKFNMEEYYEK